MKIAHLLFSIMMVGISAHASADSLLTNQAESSIESAPLSSELSSSAATRCMSLDTTSDIFMCLEAAYQLEDKKLNLAYARLAKLLKSNEPARLILIKKAEVAWISLRDEDCAFDSSADGAGESSSAAIQICMIRETTQRRSDLELKFLNLQQHISENH